MDDLKSYAKNDDNLGLLSTLKRFSDNRDANWSVQMSKSYI